MHSNFTKICNSCNGFKARANLSREIQWKYFPCLIGSVAPGLRRVTMFVHIYLWILRREEQINLLSYCRDIAICDTQKIGFKRSNEE